MRLSLLGSTGKIYGCGQNYRIMAIVAVPGNRLIDVFRWDGTVVDVAVGPRIYLPFNHRGTHRFDGAKTWLNRTHNRLFDGVKIGGRKRSRDFDASTWYLLVDCTCRRTYSTHSAHLTRVRWQPAEVLATLL